MSAGEPNPPPAPPAPRLDPSVPPGTGVQPGSTPQTGKPGPADTAARDIPGPTSPEYPNDDGLLLELEECVEVAIQNNLNLQISRLTDRETDYAVRIAWSQFFPTFSESLLHSNSSSVGDNSVPGHGVNTLSSRVDQASPWGTKLDFIVDESRRDINQSARSATVNFTQPLWKGFGTDANLVALRTARINRVISRGNLELSTQNLILSVRTNYSEVVRQLQVREVEREAVRSARIFLNYTRFREKSGFVTKLDVSQADVQVRQRELALISNERALDQAYDQLKLSMNLDLEYKIRVNAGTIEFGEKPPAGYSLILETDDDRGIVYLVPHKNTPEDRDHPEGPVSGEKKILFQAQHFNEKLILDEAIDNRIDLLNHRRTLAIQQLNTMLAKNGLGYQIDLVGSYGHSFNSKALRGAGSGTNSAALGSSNVNGYTAGVNVSIPWGKIADRANYETALLELQKSEINLKQARTTVHEDVRDILRALREAEKTLLTDALLVEQAKRTVEATTISFQRGLKDSFQVVKVEDDLLAAKNDFISSRLNYLIDLARLELVIGKQTGRVDIEGETLGGLISSHLPASMSSKETPRIAPDADPSCEDHALNNSRRYRCDPKPEPDTRTILVPTREPPCNCEIIDSKP